MASHGIWQLNGTLAGAAARGIKIDCHKPIPWRFILLMLGVAANAIHLCVTTQPDVGGAG